jgi:hypothetical protein
MACRAIEGFRRRMARERTMRFRRSYLRYGAANAAKCGATTPERLWQSQRPSYETRLRNKGGHRSPCLNARLCKKATPELG